VLTRTFTATIAQAGGALVITVPMTRWVGWTNQFRAELGKTNDVRFQLDIEDWGPLEPTVPDFYARGSVRATIAAGGLSGFLDGYVEASVPDESGQNWASSAKCTAPDHSVTFSR
jgi:hypothetical protein